jgi:hypothetical protein
MRDRKRNFLRSRCWKSSRSRRAMPPLVDGTCSSSNKLAVKIERPQPGLLFEVAVLLFWRILGLLPRANTILPNRWLNSSLPQVYTAPNIAPRRSRMRTAIGQFRQEHRHYKKKSVDRPYHGSPGEHHGLIERKSKKLQFVFTPGCSLIDIMIVRRGIQFKDLGAVNVRKNRRLRTDHATDQMIPIVKGFAG